MMKIRDDDADDSSSSLRRRRFQHYHYHHHYVKTLFSFLVIFFQLLTFVDSFSSSLSSSCRRPATIGATTTIRMRTRSFNLHLTTRSTTKQGIKLWNSSSLIVMHAAKSRTKNSKKKNKKPTSTSSGGLKGFGSPMMVKKHSANAHQKNQQKFQIDRSKEAREFYVYMEKNGAGDNLKRTALAYFPITTSTSTTAADDEDSPQLLRGLVALQDIKKGDDIINIPYEMAINLGREGDDPTLPAIQLLHDYCATIMTKGSNGANDNNANDGRIAYYTMLPQYGSDDCMGSTDFYSNEILLEELQSPLIAQETLKRRERTKQRLLQQQQKERDDDGTITINWIDGQQHITIDHLQWAVWLITSRVLTVQASGVGAVSRDENDDFGGSSNASYRLLIPYLDMCNHDRTSPHILTGLARPGGRLRIIAGCNVDAGEQIYIKYGGGMAGNDRFIQDYGFLDDRNEAYDIVAQQILGKRRVSHMGEGSSGLGRSISSIDREETLKQLRTTTIQQDEEILERIDSNSIDENNSNDNVGMRMAVQYRLGLKKALSKYLSSP